MGLSILHVNTIWIWYVQNQKLGENLDEKEEEKRESLDEKVDKESFPQGGGAGESPQEGDWKWYVHMVFSGWFLFRL